MKVELQVELCMVLLRRVCPHWKVTVSLLLLLSRSSYQSCTPRVSSAPFQMTTTWLLLLIATSSTPFRLLPSIVVEAPTRHTQVFLISSFPLSSWWTKMYSDQHFLYSQWLLMFYRLPLLIAVGLCLRWVLFYFSLSPNAWQTDKLNYMPFIKCLPCASLALVTSHWNEPLLMINSS